MLEDLTPQGFIMAKSKILDYPHLRLALRCLGEFHACSFITRYADPKSFEKLKRIEEPMFLQKSESQQDTDKNVKVQKALVDIVLKVLRLFR